MSSNIISKHAYNVFKHISSIVLNEVRHKRITLFTVKSGSWTQMALKAGPLIGVDQLLDGVKLGHQGIPFTQA